MDNLFQFLDKILPLISTLLGAYITYFVTVSSKKSELKVNAQTKARDEYWIPCSIAISNLQKKIVKLTKKENCYVTFQGENSCEQELQELLKYLQADKRIYFYERTRNILTLLNESIEIYETAVNDDVRSILNIFRKQYYAMIKEFSVYKNNNCTDCEIAIRTTFPQEIKEGILTQKGIIWFGQVYDVDFVRGDYSNTFSTDMTYGSEDFYYEVWLQIKEYGRQREEFGLSPEQELGLDVLDYEFENFRKFTSPLVEFIKGINYQNKYTAIFETLSLLQDEIFKNIDDVTIL